MATLNDSKARFTDANQYGEVAVGGGGGTPADAVTDETAFGGTPAVGTATEYARADHTHGTPPDPLANAKQSNAGVVGTGTGIRNTEALSVYDEGGFEAIRMLSGDGDHVSSVEVSPAGAILHGDDRAVIAPSGLSTLAAGMGYAQVTYTETAGTAIVNVGAAVINLRAQIGAGAWSELNLEGGEIVVTPAVAGGFIYKGSEVATHADIPPFGSLASQDAGAVAITGGSVAAAILDKGGATKNAKAYGVVGNGVADDTAAIQALINGLVTGDHVTFPAGRYKLTNTIVIGNGSAAGASTVSYISIRGAGQGIDVGNLNPGYGGATTFEWAGPAGVPVFQINGPITVNMSDFDILGVAGGNTCGDGILAVYTMMSTFERISVRRHGGAGVRLTAYSTRPTGASNNPANIRMSQVYCYYGNTNNYQGLVIDSPYAAGGVGADIVQLSVIGCKFTGSATKAAVTLGFFDNGAFYECLLSNQAGGPALTIYPALGWPLFPTGVAFYNCPIIGTPTISVDQSREVWTATNHGVGFYPWATSDTGTFPFPTDTRFTGFGDDGVYFGRNLKLSSAHFLAGGTAPTVALGASAGTGATYTRYDCNDTCGLINILTGTSPAVPDVVATVTYARAYPGRTHVVLSPWGRQTSGLAVAQQVSANGEATKFTILSGTSALAAGTNYWWTYHVIGV